MKLRKFQDGGAISTESTSSQPQKPEAAPEEQLMMMAQQVIQDLGPEGAMALCEAIQQIVQSASQKQVFKNGGYLKKYQTAPGPLPLIRSGIESVHSFKKKLYSPLFQIGRTLRGDDYHHTAFYPDIDNYEGDTDITIEQIENRKGEPLTRRITTHRNVGPSTYEVDRQKDTTIFSPNGTVIRGLRSTEAKPSISTDDQVYLDKKSWDKLNDKFDTQRERNQQHRLNQIYNSLR